MALLLAGCSCEKEKDGSEPPAASTQPAPPAASAQPAPPAASAQRAAPSLPVQKLGSRMPVGPRLIIQPGKSVGPIYFGATVETIERLMEAPCDHRSEERCVYVKQALEFYLKDGVMVGAKAYLRDRPVPGTGERFGTFNGGMAPGMMLGLHRHVVLEEYDPPEKKEQIPLKGPTGLIARHFHPGVIFEFDKIENGNVVLSSIEVVPIDDNEPKAASDAP